MAYSEEWQSCDKDNIIWKERSFPNKLCLADIRYSFEI